MATKVLLRKEDKEILNAIDGLFTEVDLSPWLSSKQVKQWTAFHERVIRAEMTPKKRKGEGITVTRAVDVLKGVLGKRLVLPASWPNPGKMWFIPLQNRLNSSGLQKEHIEAAAKVAAAQWKGPIKAESVIRQTDTLLSDANMEMLGLSLPDPVSADMEDL